MSRVRHASLGARSTASGREQQFPSSNLDVDTFVNVGWQHNNDSEKRSCKDRLSNFFSTIPRRVWCIVVSVFVLVLLLIAIGIILLLAFHVFTNHKVVPIQNEISTPSSPLTTNVPPVNYPLGYVIGTVSHFYGTNSNKTKIIPDYRGYKYRDRIIAYTNDSIYIIESNNITRLSKNLLFQNDCSECQLLALTDDCLKNRKCQTDSSIYCCSGCSNQNVTRCSVHGKVMNEYSKIIEYRIATDGSQLLESSYQNLNNSTIIQVKRFNEQGDIQIGLSKYFSSLNGFQYISSVVSNVDNSSSTNFAVGFDGISSLRLANETDLVDVHLDDINTSDVLTLVTSRNEKHILITLLESNKFYVIRYNLDNGCVSVLVDKKYISFMYPGSLINAYWIDGDFLIQYTQRDGVYLVQFSFSWQDDSVCKM